MKYSVTACCKTDRGSVREVNEDVCFADSRNHCYLVADGMGGKAGGDIASSLFRQATDEVFSDTQPDTLKDAIARVESCFNLAHGMIHEYVESKPEFMGMGCTADLLTFHGNTCIIGHVGDSRTYRWAGDKLLQLTADHSLVHEQVNQGVLSAEEAEKSRYRNVLLQAVGVDMQLDIDIITEEVQPGTQFLICSDGLYTMVRQEDIIEVLAYDAPLQLKAELLINMANDSGGKDNISVTIVELSGDT